MIPQYNRGPEGFQSNCPVIICKSLTNWLGQSDWWNTFKLYVFLLLRLTVTGCSEFDTATLWTELELIALSSFSERITFWNMLSARSTFALTNAIVSPILEIHHLSSFLEYMVLKPHFYTEPERKNVPHYDRVIFPSIYSSIHPDWSCKCNLFKERVRTLDQGRHIFSYCSMDSDTLVALNQVSCLAF